MRHLECVYTNSCTRPGFIVQATPPIPAGLVWHLLPPTLQEQCTATTLVSNTYLRLAMGWSHSVHVLMMINFKIIGATLRSHRLLNNVQQPEHEQHVSEIKHEEPLQPVTLASASAKLACDFLLEEYEGLTDQQWFERQQSRLFGRDGGAACSLTEFDWIVRQRRSAFPRIFIAVYFSLGLVGSVTLGLVGSVTNKITSNSSVFSMDYGFSWFQLTLAQVQGGIFPSSIRSIFFWSSRKLVSIS